MEKIFYLVSLGCPKNLVDSEVMAAKLLMDGWRITADAAQASLYLINTCAFLPSARREAEEAIRTAIRWKRRNLELLRKSDPVKFSLQRAALERLFEDGDCHTH